MAKSRVAIHNDVIEQGETFYREVILTEAIDSSLPYSESNSQVVDYSNKVPRSTLMDAKTGEHVANFACAVLDATGEDPLASGYKPKRLAWTMPRETTGALNYKKAYLHNIDLDDIAGGTTARYVKGDITVEKGQPHP